MIPNTINGTVYSLTFRNINGKKQFLKLGATTHLFYGMGNLPEDFTYGIPIVIVEGNMDCDVAKLIYPYTLATLTNSISQNQIRILAGLTNKVVIAYDNDEAGNQGYWNAYNNLVRYGFKVKRFKHSDNIKDFGDLIDAQINDTDLYNHLLHLYIGRLQNLINEF
jgi:DNA primase